MVLSAELAAKVRPTPISFGGAGRIVREIDRQASCFKGTSRCGRLARVAGGLSPQTRSCYFSHQVDACVRTSRSVRSFRAVSARTARTVDSVADEQRIRSQRRIRSCRVLADDDARVLGVVVRCRARRARRSMTRLGQLQPLLRRPHGRAASTVLGGKARSNFTWDPKSGVTCKSAHMSSLAFICTKKIPRQCCRLCCCALRWPS